MHSRKSLLFADNKHWVKKEGDPDFDVTMGSYDGAELCELVGLYILYRLGQRFGVKRSGVYRDDGLSCFENITSHKADSIRKDMIQMFNDEFKLKITISANLKIIHFLDVTFNLNYRSPTLILVKKIMNLGQILPFFHDILGHFWPNFNDILCQFLKN